MIFRYMNLKIQTFLHQGHIDHVQAFNSKDYDKLIFLNEKLSQKLYTCCSCLFLSLLGCSIVKTCNSPLLLLLYLELKFSKLSTLEQRVHNFS
jgi:hypothetical protein